MTDTTLLDRITVDPEICGGRPCIRGHRIHCLRCAPSSLRPLVSIAVLRVPDLPGHADLIGFTARFAEAMAGADITAKLWVVDMRRVREYRPGAR